MTEEKGPSAYNKDYYLANVDKIKESRKNRYATDPEYRRKMKLAARASKIRLASEKKAQREDDAQAKRKKMPILTFQVTHQDKTYAIQMVGILFLATSLGRGIKAIRAWEAQGQFPRAVYRSELNERLYTLFQLQAITAVYADAKRRYSARTVAHRIASTGFFEAVQKLWSEYPLGFDPTTARKT